MTIVISRIIQVGQICLISWAKIIIRKKKLFFWFWDISKGYILSKIELWKSELESGSNNNHLNLSLCPKCFIDVNEYWKTRILLTKVKFIMSILLLGWPKSSLPDNWLYLTTDFTWQLSLCGVCPSSTFGSVILMLDGLACFRPGPLDILVSSRTSTQKTYYSIVFSVFSENQKNDIFNEML